MNFLNTFSKNAQISNFINIRPMRDEMFHSEGPMGRHNQLIVAFCNADNSPKKEYSQPGD